MGTVLIPLPSKDFDPTEVAVSWKVLRSHGHAVVFATPDGQPAEADELMLSGRGLDPWGFIPGLRLLVMMGRALRADSVARAAYAEMTASPEFRAPIRWDDIDLTTVSGLLLPGGHRARGMRVYLESSRLQQTVVDAFSRSLPVAAVCHGVLLAARSIDARTGRSVLHGRKTTALMWSMERLAWRITRFTRFWDRHYYRTYLEEPGQPAGHMSVQAEVSRALAKPEDFLDVLPDAADRQRKISGRHRDRLDDERPAFVVRDGNYLSARWPGDVHTFAKQFAAMLSGTETSRTAA